jgi:iron complex transport system substrate-binding protein
MFRVKTFEANTAILSALFFLSCNGSKTRAFRFWILDFGFGMTSLKNFNQICAIVIAAVLVASFGCAPNTNDVPPVEVAVHDVRDDLGRTVKVPVKIERAISLAPSLTETIFAIGAGDRLVGVTTYCNYPPAAALIEKVGDTQTPNIERIVALKPQVVFVSTASQLEAFSKTLDEQGIAVYVTNPSSLDHVLQNMRQLGELFGQEYADSVVVSLAGRASWVRHEANFDRDQLGLGREAPRVFLQISNEPLFTIGRDSFLTELIEQAGGVSVTKDVASGYPKLSKESAAALDPDVIILSNSDDNLEPNAAFKDSKAVEAGRVFRIDPDIISRPGPRLVDALEEIARMLKRKN